LPAPPWRPVSELAWRPGPLLDRIASVRAALARSSGRMISEIDPRAAASAAHLALAARLVAPPLGAAVLGYHADMRIGGLWWQDRLGGPVPLSLPEPPVTGAPDDRAAGPRPWAGSLLDDVVAPVTIAVSRLASVSGRVLWGNVASGINAAASQVAASRPDLAGAAWAHARAAFASPWLSREQRPPGPAFQRSSCCLFYRLAPDGQPARLATCGDCVLSEPR
jgi:hypothetical protein